MRISDAELRAKVLTGSLLGVALDTSVFIKSRFLFHAGLPRQLERFKESGIACLITDVVRREMLKHHEDEVDKAELALKKASAACDDLQMLPLDFQRRMKERSSLNACDHSKSRIDSYLSEIGAVVLGVAEWV